MTSDEAPGPQTSGSLKPKARRSRGLFPATAAVVWTLIVLVGFAVLPFYSTHSSSVSSDGTTINTTGQETIFEHEGMWVLVVLLVPVFMALVGLVGAVFRLRAAVIGAAIVATGFCLFGLPSIGLFYFPAAVLLIVAAVRFGTEPKSAVRVLPPQSGSATTDRWLSVLVGGCIGWALLGLIVAALGFRDVNDDARLLAGAASILGPAAAVAAAVLLAKGRARWAGLALVVSVITPTYMAWVLNVPALGLGIGLLATGSRPSSIRI